MNQEKRTEPGERCAVRFRFLIGKTIAPFSKGRRRSGEACILRKAGYNEGERAKTASIYAGSREDVWICLNI